MEEENMYNCDLENEEYVVEQLEHTDDKSDLLDHGGDSNNSIITDARKW